MRAMILAAGRGERMRPLTDHTPKPLLTAGGRTLIEWQIQRLARAGFRDLVINVSHLAPLIEAALGDGGRLGVRIVYSREPQALETAGGIARALDALGRAPFVAVNADIYCEYDYGRLTGVLQAMTLGASRGAAHVVLVDNPAHNAGGDLVLETHGGVTNGPGPRLTFSGIAAYHPVVFAQVTPGAKAALAPLLRGLAAQGALTGERFAGRWVDVGTPQRLARLRELLGEAA